MDLTEPNVVDADTLRRVPEELCRRFLMCPLQSRGNTLYVGMANPEDSAAIDTIRTLIKGVEVQPVVALARHIKWAIDMFGHAGDSMTLGAAFDDDDDASEEIEYISMAKSAPPPKAASEGLRTIADSGNRAAQAGKAKLGEAGAVPAAGNKPADVAEGSTLRRRTTTRHYTQMNPLRHYPLLVLLTRDRVEKIQMKAVAQSEGGGVTIKAANPLVEIVPRFPGCIVVPDRLTVDVRPDAVEGQFFVTPLGPGEIPHARIEIWYEGQRIDTINTPTRVTTQVVARMLALFGALNPMVFGMIEGLGLDPKGQLSEGSGALLMQLAARFNGSLALMGLAAAAVCVLAAVGFWWLNKPRHGDPVEQFMNWEARTMQGQWSADPTVGRTAGIE